MGERRSDDLCAYRPYAGAHYIYVADWGGVIYVTTARSLLTAGRGT